MAPFTRPENVLKRSEELIAVDQSAAALELLYDTLSNKRTRAVSQSYLEPIVLKFVELSVELRKSKVVKDGLHQYKKTVQGASIGSLEVVVKRFLELSEQKVASAQAQADKITLDADEDLEEGETPEDILMSTVSSEQTKDRTDREVVTPWLKFLWEAYRSTLDVLRNNSKLEVLYQTVVKQAFQFCLRYNRKTEFRRLCELLRSHLQSVSIHFKTSTQQYPIDLSDPETLQRYLDTRFEQLNVSVKLELWQEAFRSVEDVHTQLTMSKRSPKGSTMANYYENLARIFLVSGNQLFHAAAWSKFYNLVLQARSVPEAEMTRIASLLLLSALSIPSSGSSSSSSSPAYYNQPDDTKHRNARLSGLLNLSKTPTRESLISSALSKNVLAYVRPEIRELYKILEVEFHPLSLKSRLSPVLERIGRDTNYSAYVSSLYQVILTRLFQQLSKVYKTIRLDFVISLATLPAPFRMEPVEIEKFIVRKCQAGAFALRIDHASKSLTFIDEIYDDLSSSSKAYTSSTLTNPLQDSPSAIVRGQLTKLSKTLFATLLTVDPIFKEERTRARAEAQQRAVEGMAAENAQVLERQQTIESRQRAAEEHKAEREREEQMARQARLQAEQQAEQQRLAEDTKNRELERIRREQQAIHESEKRKIAEEINAKGIIKIDVSNLDDLDTEKLRLMQVEQLAKEQKDLGERLRIIARRIDHLERASRLEEAKLWEQEYAEQQARDVKLYEKRTEIILEKSRLQFEEHLALKERLQRVMPEYTSFKTQVETRYAKMIEAKRKENARLLEQEKQARIKEVMAQRQAQREQEEREQAERERREAERERREAEERAKPQVYQPGALHRTQGVPGSTPAPRRPVPAAAASTPAPSSGAYRVPSRSNNPFGAAAGREPVPIRDIGPTRPTRDFGREPSRDVAAPPPPKSTSYVPPNRRR